MQPGLPAPKSLTRLAFYLAALSLLSASVILTYWQRVDAMTGNLDPTFGAGGVARLQGNGVKGTATAAVLQPDGRIVISFYVASAFNPTRNMLARLNTDGSLDPSFGTNGIASSDAGSSLALQQDGKIVLAGTIEYIGTTEKPDLLLSRYNANGSIDTSFGAGGRIKTDFLGREDAASAVIVQPNQKIVVAGVAYTGDSSTGKEGSSFALARYNTNGSLDASFGAGGKVLTNFPARFSLARDMTLQPDGKLVVAGKALSKTPSIADDDFALARYNTDGSLDASFGAGGMVTSNFSHHDDAYAVAVQADGRIIIGGTTRNSLKSTDDTALLRYNADGSPDNTFGVGGLAVSNFSSRNNRIEKVLVQLDGKIIAVGDGVFAASGENSVWMLSRYNADGTLDASFGTDGTVTTSNAANAAGAKPVNDALWQPDGKVLVVGEMIFLEFGTTGVVARYLNDGSAPTPTPSPTATPTPTPPSGLTPVLLTEPDSERAIALDSVTLRRGPFPSSTDFNFSPDRRTRIMLFAFNMELRAGEDSSVVTAQAEDSQHKIIPLPVEAVVKVAGFDELTQVNVRLPEELTSGGDVWVSISLRGVASNKGLISIRPSP